MIYLSFFIYNLNFISIIICINALFIMDSTNIFLTISMHMPLEIIYCSINKCLFLCALNVMGLPELPF